MQDIEKEGGYISWTTDQSVPVICAQKGYVLWDCLQPGESLAQAEFALRAPCKTADHYS